MTLSGNKMAGIELIDADNGAGGNLIRGNTLDGNPYGIQLLSGTQGTLIRDNTVTGAAEGGIELIASSGNRIEANPITGSSGSGILLSASSTNMVVGNTVYGSSDTAVVLEESSNGNRVEGNELTESEAGIQIADSSGNDVIANIANGMSDDGIGLSDALNNVVRGNDVRFNTSGIDLHGSSRNRIEANDASDASSTGIAIGALSLNNVVVLNTASGSSADGISVEAEVLPESTEPGNIIDQNKAENNTGDGISVNKAGHRISANKADNNGGWGIYAEVGNVDGGGNRATGNSEPGQCYRIACDGSAPTPPEVNPPDTLIVDEPSNPSNSTSASFTFTGIDDNTSLFELAFQCRLDSAAEVDWVELREPADSTAISVSGAQVRGAGGGPRRQGPTRRRPSTSGSCRSPRRARRRSPRSVPHRPPTTAERDALFTFFANEPEVTFECSLDGAVFADCLSPVLLEELLPGTHEFQVRARDAKGNLEPTPASPDVDHHRSASGHAAGRAGAESTNTTATFAFSANEPVTRFECSLDLAPFTTCTSPAEYPGLAIGAHIMRVQAVDLDGMISGEAEMVEHEWTIVPGPDTTAPETAIGTGPANPSTVTTASFTFTGTDNVTAPAGLLFECRLDSQNEADFAPCLSPHDYPNLDLPEQLEPGPHVFEVRAVDQEDNVDLTPASYEWTVAGTPTAPQTTIATAPDLTTVSTTATFTFSSSQTGSTFSCSLDGAAPAPCTSPRTYTNLAVGTHEFEVLATSANGVQDLTPAVFEWTVEPPPDTTAPETSIGSTPPATTTSPTAAFTFTANEPGVTFECSLDAAAFGPCVSPVNYTGLAAATHQFRVRGTDAAGNVDASPATFSWTVSAPPSCAAPGSVTLGANADSWVLQSSSSSNYGQDSSIKVDSKSGNNARVLVRFNLPAIPSGCQVTDAKLRLYPGRTRPAGHCRRSRLRLPGRRRTSGGTTSRAPPARRPPRRRATAAVTASGRWPVRWAACTRAATSGS